MQFPIIIYPSESGDVAKFTAHCLNMDLVADDDTVEGAVLDILYTIEAALEAAKKHNANAFSSAPQEYWNRLAGAQELPAELMERIVFQANKRSPKKRLVDIELEFDLRQLQPA